MSFTVALFSSSRVVRIAGGGAYLLVLAFGGWMLSGVIWAFHVPAAAPLPALPGYPEAVAARIAGSVLFEARVSTVAPDVSAVVSAVTTPFRLIGVFHSGNPRMARAIVQRDGDRKPMIVGNGTVLDSETTVGRITRGYIVLSSRGREVPLHLPEETPVAVRADNKQPAVTAMPAAIRNDSIMADEDN